MHRKLMAILLGIYCIGFSNFSYAFACYRHITNKSWSDWTVKVNPKWGNVYFEETSCPANGPCLIKANESVKIKYTYSQKSLFPPSYTEGIWQITDINKITKSAKYYGVNHGVDDKCPKITPVFPTEVIGFNKSADGDFEIYSDYWF